MNYDFQLCTGCVHLRRRKETSRKQRKQIVLRFAMTVVTSLIEDTASDRRPICRIAKRSNSKIRKRLNYLNLESTTATDQTLSFPSLRPMVWERGN